MPNVLYIGSGMPWAGGAGYLLRQNLLLSALADVADLHLAMFDADPQRPPPFPCRFTPIPMPNRRRASKLQTLLGDLFSGKPRMFRGYNLRPARQAVAQLKPSEFDAVFGYRIDFAYFSGVLNHRRLMVDIDDPEHIRSRRRIAAMNGGDADWRTQRDLQKLQQFEFNAIAAAGLALVCQENDSHDWPTQPQIVPNCVDVLSQPQRFVQGPRLLFVGNCAGSEQNPNVDAVRWFLADVWPRILAAVPQTEFQLVGAAGEAVRKLAASAANVQICGFVDDLVPIYAAASAAIAPIRFGTGTRVKILEAFAHACPVVSTLPGAEGIEAVPGREIELASDAADFAKYCIGLLGDPQMQDRIGRGGHALARRLYDCNVQRQRLVGMFRKFLA